MDRLSPERARALLDAVRGVRALVVGDLMLDRYVSGTVDRISPEAPVPVVRVEQEGFAVGGAGNVAANAAALGARCDIVGVVGADPEGERLRSALRALGVDDGGVHAAGARPTTVKTRVLARHQQIVRVDREVESDLGGDDASAVADAVRDRVGLADVVILEDYNKGVLVPDVVRAALDGAAESGAPTVVDPKRRGFFGFPGVTVFKPNVKELADALGEFVHPDDPAWMEATRRRLDARNLLLTLGERGMALQTGEGRSVRVPAVAVDVYDVSGAGDTVTAVTALVLAAGGSAVEAAVLANHGAAVEVGKSGVATVSPDELLAHVELVRRTARPDGGVAPRPSPIPPSPSAAPPAATPPGARDA